MVATVVPFLMFEGRAEEAMQLYVSAVPGSRIIAVERYGAGGIGPQGSIQVATFELAGQVVRCSDSPVKHAFTFTPSLSLFITVSDAGEVDRLADVLGTDGKVLMPPGGYGFSPWFAWVQDRFGVSWQINCEP
jgi:predicted 3-demethylubiquinone-9 3-methyltransferase (glyoxalase superfamily)